MTESFYEGYVAFHFSPGGRSDNPDWLAGYDQAYEDAQNNFVNFEVYSKFHGGYNDA